MKEYTTKEILEEVRTVQSEENTENKKFYMKILGSLLLTRMGQNRFKEGIFLEKDQLRFPSIFDRVIHLVGLGLLHTWLEYDDSNVFDGTRRICLICGHTESSIMNREWAYYEDSNDADALNLKEVLSYIKKEASQ